LIIIKFEKSYFPQFLNKKSRATDRMKIDESPV